jgi:hypothetical protein
MVVGSSTCHQLQCSAALWRAGHDRRTERALSRAAERQLRLRRPHVLNAYFGMGHSPGVFRVWWRALTGSDETLDNAHLMRLARRFSRRARGYAKAHNIPVVDCGARERKHDVANDYLAKTSVAEGLFLVLVGPDTQGQIITLRGGRRMSITARSTYSTVTGAMSPSRPADIQHFPLR